MQWSEMSIIDRKECTVQPLKKNVKTTYNVKYGQFYLVFMAIGALRGSHEPF